MTKIDWTPLEPGLDLTAPGFKAGHYCAGRPELGWVLFERVLCGGDPNKHWNHFRTEREFAPEADIEPVRSDGGGWHWE